MVVPKLSIPILVVTSLTAGFQLRVFFVQPTFSAEFPGRTDSAVECVVDGLRCRTMSQLFVDRYRDTPGIASIECYASERKAVISYDSSLLSKQRIQEIMEQAQWYPDGTIRQDFTCETMKER